MLDDPMSTTQLVVASKQGDNEALGRLLEQYRGYLLMLAHRYLSERLRRRVDPSDIVQLTYLEAKRDLPAFRGETPAEFAGWLRGMLKNNVATAVTRHITTKKRSIKREVNTAATAENDSGGGGWISQLPGSSTSPSGVAIRERSDRGTLRSVTSITRDPGRGDTFAIHGGPTAGANRRTDGQKRHRRRWTAQTRPTETTHRPRCRLESVVVIVEPITETARLARRTMKPCSASY